MIQPIRTDPSGSKSIERKFRDNLTQLIKNYQLQCKLFVERHQGRMLESPSYKLPIRADDLIGSFQQLADMTITQQAMLVARAAAELSYLHGLKWADKALSVRGLKNPVTGITKPFYLSPEKEAIDKIAAQNMMEIKGISDELGKRMSRTMVEGFEKSETMNLLTTRIKEVTDFGTSRAEMIARTETMRAVNAAAKDRYERNGITRVEWLAAWDDRTCEECEGLHGQVFDIDQAPDLPVHPNCRCTLAPVVEAE